MLGFSSLLEVAISATRAPLMVGASVLTGMLDIEPPMLTMLLDEDSEVVFAVEVYPGIASDRVLVA